MSREYSYRLIDNDTLVEMVEQGNLDGHEFGRIRALYAIAERIEALVEVVEGMEGKDCLNLEARVAAIEEVVP